MKLFLLLHFSLVLGTLDLNFAELKYLSDHLLPEECRRLVAAAHFKSYMMPNELWQAEQALPKDEPCIELLLHWNSAEGEGKGDTHESLEHRLRQMGRYDLADWLGRTVFHQLGEDLERSLKEGVGDYKNETTTPDNISMPTLVPIIEYSDPTEWGPGDTICLVLVAGLIIAIFGVCCFAMCLKISDKFKNRNKSKPKHYEYELMETDVSYSDSEDKFDIRQYETSM
ncbi:uncharacterized protein LOC123016362 [Tribolium madens]|uniref:uncharacterized protein LOC123016362 n=1 Tax=Tribolium madens TaxID=41895 RepID=UPI001CF73593|nr:uncharacterized protein LOC123016362 [Tribolium madens]